MNTQAQKKYKILLIGDDCIDIYRYGTVDRISPEAPVPVFNFSHDVQKAGMAGNVYENLKVLGCDANYLYSRTSTKTRLIDIRSNQQLVRIDNDSIAPFPVDVDFDLAEFDAIVISDYNKGTVSYELMEKIIHKSNHGTNFPVFIDTKKTNLERLQGAWVKINELEYSKIKSECTGLIVTRGAKGASAKWHEIEQSAPTVEVSDVTGAGDTFLASLTYEYLNTRDIASAIKFAIKASAVTVQHVGVYAPTLEEIQ